MKILFAISFCNFDLLEFGICWEMFSWGKQHIYHSFLITSFRTIFTLSIHCRVLQLINNLLPLFRKFMVIGILWIIAVITSITTWSVTFFLILFIHAIFLVKILESTWFSHISLRFFKWWTEFREELLENSAIFWFDFKIVL